MQSYVQMVNGKTSFWEYLHRSHNEHRLGITKFIILVDVWLTQGRNYVLSVILWGGLWVSGFICGFLATKDQQRSIVLGVSVAAGSAMVGPAVIGNTAWPSQVQFAVAQLIPIMLIVCILSAKRTWWKYCVALVGGAMCAETMASGVLAPFAAMAVAFAMGRIRVVLPFFVAGVSATIVYLCPTSVDHSGSSQVVFDLSHIIYFVAGLGSIAHGVGFWPSIATGVVGVVLTAILAFRIVVYSNKNDNALLALICIAVYAFLSLLAMGLSRGGGDPAWALASRYATPSILFFLAIAGALYRLRSESETVFIPFFVFAYTLSVSTFSYDFYGGVPEIKRRNEILDHIVAVEKVGGFDPNFILQTYPDADVVRAVMDYLRENDLNIFVPVEE